MEMLREKTKTVRIGDVLIGGGHTVAIQSMTNTRNRGCGVYSSTDTKAGGGRLRDHPLRSTNDGGGLCLKRD